MKIDVIADGMGFTEDRSRLTKVGWRSRRSVTAACMSST